MFLATVDEKMEEASFRWGGRGTGNREFMLCCVIHYSIPNNFIKAIINLFICFEIQEYFQINLVRVFV